MRTYALLAIVAVLCVHITAQKLDDDDDDDDDVQVNPTEEADLEDDDDDDAIVNPTEEAEVEVELEDELERERERERNETLRMCQVFDKLAKSCFKEHNVQEHPLEPSAILNICQNGERFRLAEECARQLQAKCPHEGPILYMTNSEINYIETKVCSDTSFLQDCLERELRDKEELDKCMALEYNPSVYHPKNRALCDETRAYEMCQVRMLRKCHGLTSARYMHVVQKIVQRICRTKIF